MVKNKFDSSVEVEVTSIDSDCRARLENEEGVSLHKKFVLIELPENTSKYPRVILHNVDGAEKQECCEILEKMLFGETYVDLEDNSIRVSKPEYTDFEHEKMPFGKRTF